MDFAHFTQRGRGEKTREEGGEGTKTANCSVEKRIIWETSAKKVKFKAQRRGNSIIVLALSHS